MFASRFDPGTHTGTFAASAIPAPLTYKGGPAFAGQLTLPDDGTLRPLLLWLNAVAKTGQRVLVGTLASDDPVHSDAWDEKGADPVIRVAQAGGRELLIDPGTVLLVENMRRLTADPSYPPIDFWGYMNPGRARLMTVFLRQSQDGSGNLSRLDGTVRPYEAGLVRTPPRQVTKTRATARGRSREPEMSR